MRGAILAVALAALSASAAMAQESTPTHEPEPSKDWVLSVTGEQPPAGMQYLYGSGEAAAASVQAYRALVAYVEKLPHHPKTSVMLTPDATLDKPVFAPCKGPRAVVFDADETVILNLGAEEADARRPGWGFNEGRWAKWEKTGARYAVAVPGAIAAFARLRELHIAIVINSNRSKANAGTTIDTLREAKLGDFDARDLPGKTLYLLGDNGSSDLAKGKDSRRTAIADHYCIVAMAGDQLGDFSEVFDAKALPTKARRAAAGGAYAALWGAGWFVLPNPVYGSALKGGFEMFENADGKHWDPDAKPKEQ